MKVPVLRIVAVGEISPWGRQYLTALQEQDLIELSLEPNVPRFCKSIVPTAKPAVIFVENHPESRASIQSLRHCGRSLYIVWFGRAFTKEDFAYALDQRVYCVFENTRPDEKVVVEKLGQLSLNTESDFHFEQLIRAMKSIVVQAETDEVNLPILHEIKAAISKLESHGIRNEFNSLLDSPKGEQASHLPFHKTQDFGDALTTVHDLERTGVLWVKGASDNQEAKIEFLQGKIIAAVAGHTNGLKAIFRMFLWDTPRFLFNRKDAEDSVVVDHLEISIRHLVQQGEMLRERYERIRREIPPESIDLQMESQALHGDTSLPENDFSTLASIVEFENVSRILDFNQLPDVDIYESLIRLRKAKLIRVATK